MIKEIFETEESLSLTKELLEELSQGAPLIEYMVTVGLPQKELLKYYSDLRRMNEKEIQCAHFTEQVMQLDSKLLVPTVTSRFPYIDRPNNPFPNEFVNFCYPRGFRALQKIANSDVFTFVLTSTNGELLYCSVLKVYEELERYKLVQEHTQCMEEENAIPNYLHGNLSEIGRASKGDVKADFIIKGDLEEEEPFETWNSDEIIKKKREEQKFAYKEKQASSSSEGISLKRIGASNSQDFSPTSLKSLATKTKYRKSDSADRMQRQSSLKWMSKTQRKKVYLPTCVGIISKFPLFSTFRTILETMNDSYNQFTRYPFEYYIEYLTLNVPGPPRGVTKVKFKLFDESDLIIEQTPMNKMPNVDVNFKLLIKMLSVDNVLKIFNCILLEHPVILMSSALKILTPICESIKSLLFPFVYEYIYVPLLPASLIDYLNSTLPFLIGIDKSLKEEAIPRLSCTTCVVDVDANVIVIFTSSPELQMNIQSKIQKVPDIPQLPEFEKNKLKNRLSHTGQKAHLEANRSKQVVEEIRHSFLLFFVGLFKQYGKYIDERVQDVNNLSRYFNKAEFMNLMTEDMRPFLSAFFKTNYFKNFLKCKMKPPTYEDALRILFFDENITARLSRGVFTRTIPTPFLSDTTTFSHQHVVEIPFKFPREPLMMEVMRIYQESNLPIPFVECVFQNGIKGYLYHILPSLHPTLYPPIYTTALPMNLISQSYIQYRTFTHLPKLWPPAIYDGYNSNSIFWIWTRLWSGTLCGCEEREQVYVIEQLMDVWWIMNNMETGVRIEEVEDAMMGCLLHGTTDMVVRIFEHMFQYKLTPTRGIYAILMKSIFLANNNIAALSYIPLPRESSFCPPPVNEEFKISPPAAPSLFKISRETENMFTLKMEDLERGILYGYRFSLLDLERGLGPPADFFLSAFGDRTAEDQPPTFFQNLVMTLKGKCENCDFALKFDEIKSGNRPGGKCMCTTCKLLITPQLEVQIGSENLHNHTCTDRSVFPTRYETHPYLSLERIRQQIASLLSVSPYQIYPMELKRSRPTVYYNTLFHLSEADLPVDFLLPSRERMSFSEYQRIGRSRTQSGSGRTSFKIPKSSTYEAEQEGKSLAVRDMLLGEIRRSYIKEKEVEVGIQTLHTPPSQGDSSAGIWLTPSQIEEKESTQDKIILQIMERDNFPNREDSPQPNTPDIITTSPVPDSFSSSGEIALSQTVSQDPLEI